MNRTLLLENLPDLLEDLDARLTALEAAEPQAQPVKISYVEHLAAEVKQLRESLYASRLDREALQAEIKRLTDGFYALEAQRNALAAQLDDLVESMKYLLSEAEPNKERMTALESLQDENATLRSRLAATSRQTDEIKRLEAVCDDLSDKLDAANCR